MPAPAPVRPAECAPSATAPGWQARRPRIRRPECSPRGATTCPSWDQCNWTRSSTPSPASAGPLPSAFPQLADAALCWTPKDEVRPSSTGCGPGGRRGPSPPRRSCAPERPGAARCSEGRPWRHRGPVPLALVLVDSLESSACWQGSPRGPREPTLAGRSPGREALRPLFRRPGPAGAARSGRWIAHLGHSRLPPPDLNKRPPGFCRAAVSTCRKNRFGRLLNSSSRLRSCPDPTRGTPAVPFHTLRPSGHFAGPVDRLNTQGWNDHPGVSAMPRQHQFVQRNALRPPPLRAGRRAPSAYPTAECSPARCSGRPRAAFTAPAGSSRSTPSPAPGPTPPASCGR